MFLLFPVTHLHAESDRHGKNFAADFSVGIPHLLGLQLSYIGLTKFSFGLGFGSLPINSLLQRQIPLNSVPLETSDGSSFELQPSATYRLYSTSVFARFYPWDAGFFTQLGYSQMIFQADVNVGLQNLETESSLGTVLNGSLSFNMPTFTTTLGYEFFWKNGFFIGTGLGIGYLVHPTYTLTFGGTATDLASLVDDASADLEQAENDIREQLDQGIVELQNTLKVIPSLFLSVGFSF